MGFEADPWLAVAALVFGALVLGGWLWQKGDGSHLLFSDVEGLAGKPSLRVKMSFLPGAMKGMALFCLLAAVPNPRLSIDVNREVGKPPLEFGDDFDEFEEDRETPTEGVALYMVLDQSGSMEKGMALDDGQRMPRIDVLKRVTAEFIRSRSDDMIGLVSFARVAHVRCPLTLDRHALLKEVRKLHVVGSSREDGTAIGYALFKTANLIAATRYFGQEASYDIKSSAVVLVTDGLQNSHPLDKGHELREMSVLDAGKYAAEKGVKVYIINVEPLVLYPQYAEQREELRRAAEITGGKFYIAGDTESLRDVYAEIDALERSLLPLAKAQQGNVRESRVRSGEENSRHTLLLYPYLTGMALVGLFGAVLLQTTWLRRVL